MKNNWALSSALVFTLLSSFLAVAMQFDAVHAATNVGDAMTAETKGTKASSHTPASSPDQSDNQTATEVAVYTVVIAALLVVIAILAARLFALHRRKGSQKAGGK